MAPNRLPKKGPLCPDCASARTRPIVYGEPPPELGARADKGELVIGGCLISDESPTWDCTACGNRFGSVTEPRARLRPRSPEEWSALVETMMPTPSRRDDAGDITGGNPITVIVRVTARHIQVMEPELVWERTDLPTSKATPFARAPLRSAASRVAELIILASSKRLSRYRWCPRCRETHEPERMLDSVCHGCAEKVLGVVF